MTVQYLDGYQSVYEVGRLVTESAQWKLQRQSGSDDSIVLIPMRAVRHISMETTASGGTAGVAVVGSGGGGGLPGNFTSTTWTVP